MNEECFLFCSFHKFDCADNPDHHCCPKVATAIGVASIACSSAILSGCENHPFNICCPKCVGMIS